MSAPDIREADRMVRSFARSYRKKYRHLPVSYDDLYADGLYGAYKAAVSWDPEKGSSYTSWAYRYIQIYMTLGVRFQNGENTQGKGGGHYPLEWYTQDHTGVDDEGTEWDTTPASLRQDETPETIYLAKEERELVLRAMMQLPSKDRDTVVRAFWYGQGPTQIARETGTHKTQVRRDLDRAYAAMRPALEEVAA